MTMSWIADTMHSSGTYLTELAATAVTSGQSLTTPTPEFFVGLTKCCNEGPTNSLIPRGGHHCYPLSTMNAADYPSSDCLGQQSSDSRLSSNTAQGDYQCRFGTNCPIPIHDASPSGITRHLKEFHVPLASLLWHDRWRGVCMWYGAHGFCGKEMNYASFGKHIATHHLRSMSQRCPYCHKLYGRVDSLKRHLKTSCRFSFRQMHQEGGQNFGPLTDYGLDHDLMLDSIIFT